MAWLSGYSCRQQINVTGKSGAGINYRILLLVGESSGASGGDFDLNSNCTNFPNDIRFTDNDGVTKLKHELELPIAGTSPNRLATVWVEVADNLDSDQSIYCYYGRSGASSDSQHVLPILEKFDFRSSGVWHGNCGGTPSAIHYAGTYNKTYWSFIRQDGGVVVKSYDHNSGEVDEYIVATLLHASDHLNPSLLIRSDGKVIVFYSWPNSDASQVDYIYCKISTNAEDISSWGSQITVTYQSNHEAVFHTVCSLSGESNKIYCFFREQQLNYASISYVTSTDNGSTWSSSQRLLQGISGQSWVYLRLDNDANTIYFAVSWHPYHVTSSIYAFYYENGYLYEPDGTQICAFPSGLPIDQDDLTGTCVVYDATEGGHYKAWIWEIALHNGTPYIVFDTFAVEWTDHRYNYARWTGSAWDEHEITHGGGYISEDISQDPGCVTYSGGITIDQENPNIVYISTNYNLSQFEIKKGITSDGGASWNWTDITSGSSYKNCRPKVVYNHTSDFPILWLCGPYGDYHDASFSTRIIRESFEDIWAVNDAIAHRSCLDQNQQFELRNPHTAARPIFTGYMRSVNTVTSRIALVENYLSWTTDSANEAWGGACLYFDDDNYALIQPRDSAGVLRCRIFQGGSEVYSYISSVSKGKTVRVTYDFSNYNIKFYYWSGSAWTQLGTTQTYNLGSTARVCLSAYDHTGFTGANPVIIDGLYFRSVTDPEPVFSSAGSEETTGGWTGKISGVNTPAKIMGIDVANIAEVKGVA